MILANDLGLTADSHSNMYRIFAHGFLFAILSAAQGLPASTGAGGFGALPGEQSSGPAELEAAPEVFRYQNPISDGLDPHGVRDCQVIRENDKWYMIASAWPHWPSQEAFGIRNPGVVLYSSEDLLKWTFEDVIVPAPCDSDKWYRDRFWAPEVHKIKGRYYAAFNCSNPERGYPGQHFGFAVAEELRGPYRIVTEDEPLGAGNDLTLFEDDDGKVWAFWDRGRDFGIGFAQIDLDQGRLLTEPVSAIQPGRADEAPGVDAGHDQQAARKGVRFHEWDSIGIEGAYVIKHKGTYYLFYSSWTRGYEIGYATAPRVTGPWTKSASNPFYGGQSERICRTNRLPYTDDPANPFSRAGHNHVFTGPDGRLWLSCHGVLKSNRGYPMLVIDPLEFDARGNLVKKSPTHTPQVVFLP